MLNRYVHPHSMEVIVSSQPPRAKMSKKTVFISYLAHNVVFKIAVDNPEGDVAILRAKFLLKFTDQINVTFQRYDAEWGCDEDLNDDDEVYDKDRLKAIVSPAQVSELKLNEIMHVTAAVLLLKVL